jgi:hypothetical protein
MSSHTRTSSFDDFVCESIDGTGATVDEEASVIRGVKLIGQHSKNNREYPLSVLKSAVSLYEGANVNADHSENPTEPRKIADRIGVIQNARFVEGKGVFGDFHFNPKHSLAEQVKWAARKQPSTVGFSHVASVKAATVRGKTLVESILSVKSVDLVSDPATTRSIFESEGQNMEVDFAALTVEQITEKRPDLVEALTKTQETVSEIKSLKTKLKDTEARLAAIARESEIDKELAEAGLDSKNKTHVSEVFRSQLSAIESKDERAKLVGDRVALLKETTKGAVSFTRESTDTKTEPDMAAIRRAIVGH